MSDNDLAREARWNPPDYARTLAIKIGKVADDPFADWQLDLVTPVIDSAIATLCRQLNEAEECCIEHGMSLALARSEIRRLTHERDEAVKALAQATQEEFSMARRMRSAVVEARRRLAKGRALWNGPCHECDAVLAEALSVDCPTTDQRIEAAEPDA